jgi:putative toxin-antitoxin system antitoxin component (TIGR02293 family)
LVYDDTRERRDTMSQRKLAEEHAPSEPKGSTMSTSARGASGSPSRSLQNLLRAAAQADHGISKTQASRLFERVASGSSLPVGRLRAEIIPDSSWKRSGKTLRPSASQTTARLAHILAVAESIWGNEADAAEWLNNPHPELRGATPYSLLKTEAGGRTVEALLGALEYGFPV